MHDESEQAFFQKDVFVMFIGGEEWLTLLLAKQFLWQKFKVEFKSTSSDLKQEADFLWVL